MRLRADGEFANVSPQIAERTGILKPMGATVNAPGRHFPRNINSIGTPTDQLSIDKVGAALFAERSHAFTTISRRKGRIERTALETDPFR